MLTEIEFKGTLSELIDGISNSFPCNDELWFRGQSNYTFSLIPRVFRQGPNFGVSYNESEMYHEFIRRFPEQSTNHKTIFEWLTLMQHYTLPTRVLDWTTNLLVALFFCCRDDQEEDGAIFVFDPSYLKQKFQEMSVLTNKFLEIEITSIDKRDFLLELLKTVGDALGGEAEINGKTVAFLNNNYFIVDEPLNSVTYVVYDEGTPEKNDLIDDFSCIIPYKPPYLNPRIKAQHGVFTIHGGKYFNGNAYISPECMENIKDLHVVKVRVKACDKNDILKELHYSGIKEATLFPEMDYQSKDILQRSSKLIIK